MPEMPKFKGLKRGPFRRPTRENEVQTLDIGVGKAERFIARANKRPEREYVGVDLSIDVQDASGRNYKILGQRRANNYLQYCIDNGIKLRNINFDMPIPVGDVYRLHDFFGLLSKVLVPNGKVFMNSEEPSFLLQVADIATSQQFGFSVRQAKADPKTIEQLNRLAKMLKLSRTFTKNPLKRISLKEILDYQKRTGKLYELNGVPISLYMQQMFRAGYTPREFLYTLEITYPLTKAYPGNTQEAKEQRRNWTKQ